MSAPAPRAPAAPHPAPYAAPGDAPAAQRARGYTRWQGERTAQGLRWWVIARGNLSLALSNRWVKIVLIASFLPAVVASGLVYFLVPLSAPMLHTVLNFSMPFTFLVGAIMGARMIAEDRRQGAFLAHFARPVKRADYMLGKLVALMVPLLFVSAAPGLFAIAADASVDTETLTERLQRETGGQGGASGFDTVGYLVHIEYPGAIGAVLLFGLVASFVTAGIVLGLSALATRARLAGLAWFAVVAFGFAAHGMLEEVLDEDAEWPAFLSWWDNLSDFAAGLLGLQHAPQFGFDLEYHYAARALVLLLPALAGLAVVHEQLRRAEGGVR